jgi:hypothetical protein
MYQHLSKNIERPIRGRPGAGAGAVDLRSVVGTRPATRRTALGERDTRKGDDCGQQNALLQLLFAGMVPHNNGTPVGFRNMEAIPEWT